MSPAEAIAAVDQSSNGIKGRFEIVVASAKKGSNATFLDSSPDYRAPGNVTFSLSPPAASTLKKRFGAPPEEYLLGRRIVVMGVMEKKPVMNLLYGKIRSFNRFSYGVEVRRVAQIVSID